MDGRPSDVRGRRPILQPPFYHENHQDLYRRVLEGPVQFPAGITDVSKSLITQLLDKNPATRLGARFNGTATLPRNCRQTATGDAGIPLTTPLS